MEIMGFGGILLEEENLFKLFLMVLKGGLLYLDLHFIICFVEQIFCILISSWFNGPTLLKWHL